MFFGNPARDSLNHLAKAGKEIPMTSDLIPTIPTTYQFLGERGLDHFVGNWNINWQAWSWCNLDDFVALINKVYRKTWGRREILLRFCFEHHEMRETSNKKHVPPMGFYVVDSNGGQFIRFCRQESCLAFYYSSTKRIYVPAGWTKDILWALYNDCTRFRIMPPGNKDSKFNLVACEENGSGVYIV